MAVYYTTTKPTDYIKYDTLIYFLQRWGKNRQNPPEPTRKGSLTRSQGNGQLECSENWTISLQLGGPGSPNSKHDKKSANIIIPQLQQLL